MMKGSIDRWSKQNARKPSSSPDRGVIFFLLSDPIKDVVKTNEVGNWSM